MRVAALGGQREICLTAREPVGYVGASRLRTRTAGGWFPNVADARRLALVRGHRGQRWRFGWSKVALHILKARPVAGIETVRARHGSHRGTHLERGDLFRHRFLR
jgi:hypothetical protein